MEFKYMVEDVSHTTTVMVGFADSMEPVHKDASFGASGRVAYKLQYAAIRYHGTADDKDRYEPVISIVARRFLKSGKLADAKTRLERWNLSPEVWAEFVKLAHELDPR